VVIPGGRFAHIVCYSSNIFWHCTRSRYALRWLPVQWSFRLLRRNTRPRQQCRARQPHIVRWRATIVAILSTQFSFLFLFGHDRYRMRHKTELWRQHEGNLNKRKPRNNILTGQGRHLNVSTRTHRQNTIVNTSDVFTIHWLSMRFKCLAGNFLENFFGLISSFSVLKC